MYVLLPIWLYNNMYSTCLLEIPQNIIKKPLFMKIVMDIHHLSLNLAKLTFGLKILISSFVISHSFFFCSYTVLAAIAASTA